MSFEIEFGSKNAADAAREEHAEHVCPLDDDRRLKTVAFVDDTPDLVRDQLEAGAQTGRAEREEGAGQADLTDPEKNRIGPFTGPNNYLKAASVKALLRENGVSDWEAWYDPELTVDEHKSSVLPEAQQAGGGDRIENEGPDRDAAARAEEAAGSQCDHAHDHCEHGDPDACEFLTESCGLDESDVSSLMESGADGDGVPYDALAGEEKGALDRSWTGYKTAVRKLAELLDEVAIELRNAEKAAAAIDSIEEGIRDMDTEEFEALAAHHETLHQLHQRHAGDDHGQPGEGRVPTDDDLAGAEPVRPAAGPPPEFDAPNSTDDGDTSDRLHWFVESDDSEERKGPFHNAVLARQRSLELGDGWEMQTYDPNGRTGSQQEETEQWDWNRLVESAAHDIDGYRFKELRRDRFIEYVEAWAEQTDASRGTLERYAGELADRVLGPGIKVGNVVDLAIKRSSRGEPDESPTVLEQNPQRDLSGDRSSPQTRFAGGETGDVESETEQHVEENPGGLDADLREGSTAKGETEQQVPDEFQVAEGGQNTL